jgi:hypothetical protein
MWNRAILPVPCAGRVWQLLDEARESTKSGKTSLSPQETLDFRGGQRLFCFGLGGFPAKDLVSWEVCG